MNAHLLAALKRFVANVVDAVASGGAMYVLVPVNEEKSTHEELVGLLRLHYSARGKTISTLAVSPDWNYRDPQAILRDKLKVKPEARKKTQWPLALLAESTAWPDLLIVSGIEQLGTEAQRAWARFSEQWGQYSHAHGCRRVLLALCSWSIAALPREDLRCQVSKFFREPVWEETVYPDLCGSDQSLLERVCQFKGLAEEELLAVLKEYGREMGWNHRHLENLGAGLVARIGHMEHIRIRYLKAGLPEILGQLEHIGATVRHPIYGLELHPSAAALLGQRQVVDRRIWRGQVAVLYPMLDAVRLDICRFLQISQPGWHTKVSYDRVNTTYEDPTSDFGHLACTCDVLGGGRLRAVSQLVWDLSELRNKLAHYQPLSVHDFYRVANLIAEIDLTPTEGELRSLHQRYVTVPTATAAPGRN